MQQFAGRNAACSPFPLKNVKFIISSGCLHHGKIIFALIRSKSKNAIVFYVRLSIVLFEVAPIKNVPGCYLIL